MTGGMDYSGFLQLKRQIETMAAGFDGFIRGFLLKQGLDALAKTKRQTPVDTGVLRGAWELDGVIRKGDTLEVTLVNPMEYASFVEYGHLTATRKDWVEGYFMCTLSIADVERRIPGRWNREFVAWCRGLGADAK